MYWWVRRSRRLRLCAAERTRDTSRSRQRTRHQRVLRAVCGRGRARVRRRGSRSPCFRRASAVHDHAIENQLMKPIVRARAVRAQGLEDHQRLFQADRVVDRALQPEVPSQAPGRCHPVEDKSPRLIDRPLIHDPDARRRDVGDEVERRWKPHHGIFIGGDPWNRPASTSCSVSSRGLDLTGPLMQHFIRIYGWKQQSSTT